eukprot:158751-Chlamydomonas_euryale.AAC.6
MAGQLPGNLHILPFFMLKVQRLNIRGSHRATPTSAVAHMLAELEGFEFSGQAKEDQISYSLRTGCGMLQPHVPRAYKCGHRVVRGNGFQASAT